MIINKNTRSIQLFHLTITCSVFLCIILYSCISESNFRLPEYKKEAVLNCLVKNDSSIAVSMHWSSHPNDTNFIPITNAEIFIIKEGEIIESQTNSNNSGDYIFKHIGIPNTNYTIEAITDNLQLNASTSTPLKPNLSISEIGDNNWSPPLYSATINHLSKTISALYFYFFIQHSGGSQTTHESPYCNSPFADSFNAYLDNWGPEGFNYSYDYFVRIDGNYLRNNKTNINFSLLSKAHKVVIQVVAANKEYDMYFKSAYIQRSFDPNINLPFSYYPVPIPTNITGGTGTFSAIDISEFIFTTSAK